MRGLNVKSFFLGRRGRLATKTLLVLLVFALFLTIGLTISNLNTYLQTEKEKRGQRIAVTAATEQFSFTYQNITLVSGNYELNYIPESEAVKFYNTFKRQITVYAPKKVRFFTVNGQKTAVIYLDFSEEKKYRPYWEVLGKYPERAGEILAGSDLAREYKLKVGDLIDFGAFKGKVVGILKPTGKNEDGFFFASLKESSAPPDYFLLQAILKPGDDTVKSKAYELFPDLNIDFIMGPEEQRFNLLLRYQVFGSVLAVVLLIMGFLLVKSFLENDLLGRSREIGIFAALGFKTKVIVKIILMEDLLAVLLGVLAAWPLGLMVTKVILQKLAIPYRILLSGINIAFLSSFLIAVGMNYYKLGQILRLPITELLRGNAGD
ncbi:ABC transporter permease [Carboxydothermus ferrireducens]|uniref:ABC transport system permease protein n=1 Tax=Carboxydothermus ferrireducens DSM 11255 TaxID=1119529 RepID=A0ABX2RC91_9THEO|nr:FtsX-like permease family protein [Carboxydothermus ferrireducens]NYE58806.1 putative ABC transport system permease protein [Carboxydothermus ferrireducens DSM 11255]